MKRQEFISKLFTVATVTLIIENSMAEILDQKPKKNCNDLSGLTDQQKEARKNLKYVTKSTVAGKNCGNCRFIISATSPNDCAGCQLMKGPVLPEGYCGSWFKKA